MLSDDELDAELTLMTDAFTDDLFALPGAILRRQSSVAGALEEVGYGGRVPGTVRFPVSRLVVDVERFADDAKEPMAKVGMGVIYTRTAHGTRLRRDLQPRERQDLIARFYDPHHQALRAAVQGELEQHGKALIVDCHSFPSRPLPCDSDQSIPRPQFCIGTDPFHTPKALVQAALQQLAKVGTGTSARTRSCQSPLLPKPPSEAAVRQLEKMGYSLGVNRPYAGALVPVPFYKKDRRVASIMVEVNRSLYMDEPAGTKTAAFAATKQHVHAALVAINEAWMAE